MATIQIVDRKTAIRSQNETMRGDVHVCVTDTDSNNPHRAWWITEQALNLALEVMTLNELDTLVCRAGPRKTSAEYPVRDYYLPVLKDNAARAAAGESGDSLWRWRSFNPTPRSSVSAICRRDGGHWISAKTGGRLF